MKISDLLNIIKLISSSDDEIKILKNENILIVNFMVPILFLASIGNFISRYYFYGEKIQNCLIDSIILSFFSVAFFLVTKLVNNEKFKEDIFSVFFSLLLFFIVIKFYYLIGPTVWTISIAVVILSMIRTNYKMLTLISITIFILGSYIWYTDNKFELNLVYYIAQNIAFFLLFIITGGIHKIIRNRVKRISEQYDTILTSEKKLNLTLNSIGDGVISVDRDGKIEFMNPIAEKLTGWELEDAVGKDFENIFNIINEYTGEKIKSPVEKVFELGQIVEIANHTILISKDKSKRAIEDTAAPIKDNFGNVMGVVLIFRDFSYKKEKQKKIEYLSYHDQLTGLYNRRFFEEEMKRLDTSRNLPLSFIFADVNGLKTINDAFGHETGNLLITQVADVLKSECRLDDIISRTGGDEFIILLPKTEKIFAEKLADRIKKKIEMKKIMDINISISFGWDTKKIEKENSWTILKKAEDLMYQKKIFDNFSKRGEVIKSILHTLYIKSERENLHSKRVSLICEYMGKACNFNEYEIMELKVAGELHDIGKIAIDEIILNKSGKLSKKEWEQVKRHPERGYRILGTSSEYYNIAEYVLEHHERWDGRGYPKGLIGNEINLKSRIISIADAYDAMTCDRPYRKALTKEKAINEIKINAGIQFDFNLVNIFIDKVVDKIDQ